MSENKSRLILLERLRWAKNHTLVRALSRFAARRYLRQPIIVVGCGRSGTTALCSALASHDDIMGADEAPLLDYVGSLAWSYAYHEVANYIQVATRLPEEQFRQTLQKLSFDTSFTTKALLLEWFRRQRLRQSNPSHWLVKAFPSAESADGLKWIFPKAKFVYLHRCGIQVVESMSKKNWFKALSFSQRCEFWSSRVWAYEYLRERDDAFEVRYQDFLERPAEVLTCLQGKLGLPYSSRPELFASGTLVSQGDRSTKGFSPSFLMSRPPSFSQWSVEEKAQFREICGDAMDSLGYPIPF